MYEAKRLSIHSYIMYEGTLIGSRMIYEYNEQEVVRVTVTGIYLEYIITMFFVMPIS